MIGKTGNLNLSKKEMRFSTVLTSISSDTKVEKTKKSIISSVLSK